MLKLSAQQKKNLFYLIPLGVLLIGAFLFYFLFAQVQPNDKILTTSDGVALFANENPTFSVKFGDTNNPEEQKVKFEASSSNDNPFTSETKTNIFTKIASIFKSNKKVGIEMSLRGVDFSETQKDGKEEYDEEMQKVADILGTDEIKTSTVLTNMGREIGKIEDEQNISKQTIVNQNVADGVDLEYQILAGLGLKEEIVINDLEAYRNSCEKGCKLPLNEFVFDLKVDKGITIKKGWFTVEGKSSEVYYLVDEKGGYIAHFLPSFAVDGAGNKTYEVDLQIDNKGDENYEAKVTVDSDWLLDSNRVYPIRIDPSIVHDDSTDFSTGVFMGTKYATSLQVANPTAVYHRLESNVVGSWNFNETANGTCTGGGDICDQSGNNYNATVAGSVVPTSSIEGYGRRFNGVTGSYAYAGDIAAFEVQSFTVEAYVKKEGACGIYGQCEILSKGLSGWEGFGFLTEYDHLQLRINDRGHDNLQFLTGPTYLNDNVWYYFAATVDGVSKTIKLYINGRLEAAGTFTDTISYGGATVRLGNANDNIDLPFNGIIDNVKFSNVVRSSDYIKNQYAHYGFGTYNSAALDLVTSMPGMTMSWLASGVNTGNGETPYSSTGLVAQWNFNETSGSTAVSGGTCGTSCNGALTNMITSGQDWLLSPANSGWTANNRRWGAGALMFDGTNDYVNTGYTKTSGDGTVALWFKMGTQTVYTATYIRTIISQGAWNGTSSGIGIATWSNNLSTTGKLKFVWGIDSGSDQINTKDRYDDGKWHYAVLSKSGTTLSVYMDGVLLGTQTASDTVDTSTAFQIGGSSTSAERSFSGTIDAVSIYSRALSASEILSNYQPGNVEFQYRTSDDGSTWSNWTSYNDGALMFDGVNDSVDIGIHKLGPEINSSSSVSLEYWINLKSSPAASSLFQVLAVANTTGGSIDGKIDEYRRIQMGGRSISTDGFQNAISTTTLQLGTWYHIVGVYDYAGDTISIYINGSLDKTQSVSFNATSYTDSASGTLHDQMGNFTSTSRYLNGSIDNVRIYSRALGASEIAANYSAIDVDTPSDATNMVASWNLNELNGTTAVSGGTCGINCNGTLANFSNTSGKDVTSNSGWTAKTKRGSDYPEYSFDNPYLYGTSDPGLVAYWPMDDANGAIEDKSEISVPFATGGTITYSGGYTIHTFTSGGTFTVNGIGSVETLVVAGGGGGGAGTAGGGGGGGVIYESSHAVLAKSYSITIGAGGAGKVFSVSNTVGGNGGNSIFDTLTAIGGGGGGNRDSNEIGLRGGSGGGGGGSDTIVNPGTSISGQGNNGGSGRSNGTESAGGGGGGAGSIGESSPSTGHGGDGGVGVAYSISGSTVYYAGGGGGGSHSGQTVGGNGGGGAGGSIGVDNAVAGTQNTGGGGGGGAGGGGVVAGKDGGSGIVIIRYPSNLRGTYGNNDGTPVGTTYVNGIHAGGRSFNGTTDSIEVPNSPALNPSYITIELWAKSNTSAWSANAMLVSKRDVYVMHPSSGTNSMLFYIYAGGNWRSVTILQPIGYSITDWHQYVGTFDGTSIKLYLDGVLNNTTAYTGTINTADTGNLYIGKDDGAASYFNGMMDEVRIFNTALSAATIAADYTKGVMNKSISVSEKSGAIKTEGSSSERISAGQYNVDLNTLGLWHFDEVNGTGAYIKDSAATLLPFATGGTVTYSGGYTIHTFTSGGTFTVNGTGNVETLIVAGGGGGASGSIANGGGGGGGVIYASSSAVTPGAKTVTVGNGGSANTNGGDSSFNGLTVIGGGTGGNNTHAAGYAGGSGGGGGDNAAGGSGTSGQGNSGGTGYGTTNLSNGGGGGGAGLAGGNAYFSYAGNGGVGISNSISGVSTFYGGGGGGGVYLTRTAGVGGAGGGGNGAQQNGTGTAGTANTGGGGGGGGGSGTGGAGGSGIVIIRYPSTQNGGYSGKDATPTGTTYVSNGKIGGARSFNGSSDYVTIGNLGSFPTQGTIEFWMNASEIANYRNPLTTKYNGGNAGIRFEEDATGAFAAVVGNDGGTFDTCMYFSSGMKANTWYHIVYTWNTTTNMEYGYLNGVQVCGGAHSAWATTIPDLRIGTGFSTSAERQWKGMLDEVRVSNVARTANEIAEAYKLGSDSYINHSLTNINLSTKNTLSVNVASDRPGNYLSATLGESAFANYQPDANTVGLWHLDEVNGSGAYTKDSSGYGNNGTITGATYTTTGILGGARVFSGSSQYVTIPDSNSLDLTTAGTIGMWAYKTTEADWQMYLSKGYPESYQIVENAATRCISIRWGTDSPAIISARPIPLNKWTYISFTYDGSYIKLYIDGALEGANAYTTNATANTTAVMIGGRADGYYFRGTIDEVRIDNIARSAEQIRQAYEVGLRTHNITVNFGAALASGNLITGSGDYSFSINATKYGLPELGSEIFPGEKIIVKENYNGTEYIAQGTVSAVTSSTGAVTVSSWDSGSTFPSGGYTVNADVFKWQKEYIPVKNRTISSQVDAVNLLTLKINDGNEGRNIWIDDIRSSTGYLKASSGDAVTFANSSRYVQYKAIVTSWDRNVAPTISQVQVAYQSTGPTMEQIMRHGKWFDSNGIKKSFWWAGTD